MGHGAPAPALRAAILCVAMILLAPLAASGGESGSDRAQGPLDGMAFVGKIGPAGDPDLDDVLYFEDGHFWSKACTRCGFAPAPYWVRKVAEGIEFRGVLESPERGRFHYLGRVHDGRITVQINWRHERWYWSIDRDLSFRGKLARTGAEEMTLDAARATARSRPPEPDECPS